MMTAATLDPHGRPESKGEPARDPTSAIAPAPPAATRAPARLATPFRTQSNPCLYRMRPTDPMQLQHHRGNVAPGSRENSAHFWWTRTAKAKAVCRLLAE